MWAAPAGDPCRGALSVGQETVAKVWCGDSQDDRSIVGGLSDGMGSPPLRLDGPQSGLAGADRLLYGGSGADPSETRREAFLVACRGRSVGGYAVAWFLPAPRRPAVGSQSLCHLVRTSDGAVGRSYHSQSDPWTGYVFLGPEGGRTGI